jgi:tetratricopeptide (TPR) repeat protein
MHVVRRTLLLTAAFALLVPSLTSGQAQQSNPNEGTLSITSIRNDAAIAEFNAGMDDFWLQRHKSAVAHFTKALELEPHFGLARAARAIEIGGPTVAAETQAALADASTGNAAEALFILAIREFGAGRLVPARRLLGTATAMVPNDRNVALWNAWALSDTARLNALRAVAAKYPDLAGARTTLALYLMPLGFGVDSIVAANADEATRSAMEAVRLMPRESAVHAIMAHVLLASRKFPEAAQHANAAVSMLPKDPYAYQMLAQLAANDGNFAAMRSALDSAMAWTTNVSLNLSYARSRALIALSEGNPVQAQSELAAAAKQAEAIHALPEAALTHMFAATVSAATRDTPGIERHLAAAKADSVSVGVYNDYALSAYCIAGNGVNGRALLDAWKASNGPQPNLTPAQNAVRTANMHRHTACILTNEGKPKEALPEAAQADDNPYTALVLIETHKAMKNMKAADSVRTAFLARKNFSYASSATPVIRYRALKSRTSNR